MSRITLRSYQEAHYQRLVTILVNNISALDTSTMGSGKTIFALKFAQEYDLAVCVICPSVVVSNWKKYTDLYGIEVLDIISYETLRGCRGKVKHGLLSLSNNKYSPTKELVQAVRGGLFLIYDEVHKLMNETQQNEAAHCLTNTLRKEGPISRIIGLSGSPAVKEGNSYPLLKVLGFSLSPLLYRYDSVTRKYITRGLGWEELTKTCRSLDQTTTLEIIASEPLTTHNASRLCSRLFIEVVLPNIRSFSQLPPHSSLFNGRLGLYRFSEDKRRALIRAYSNIKDNIDNTGRLRGNITGPCKEISFATVPTLSRLAKRDIRRGKKVVIFVEYYETVNALEERLAEFSPLFLNGQVKPEERTKIIAKFQEDNHNHPLIIVNPKVGGAGIELDDKTGNFPRRAYIIPTYYFIDMIQAVKRICRDNTQSQAEVRIVECDQFTQNTRILSSLINKSSTLKKVLGREELLPGDYPRIYEDDDN